jgi:hypothetical protein
MAMAGSRPDLSIHMAAQTLLFTDEDQAAKGRARSGRAGQALSGCARESITV